MESDSSDAGVCSGPERAGCQLRQFLERREGKVCMRKSKVCVHECRRVRVSYGQDCASDSE